MCHLDDHKSTSKMSYQNIEAQVFKDGLYEWEIYYQIEVNFTQCIPQHTNYDYYNQLFLTCLFLVWR